MGLSGGAMAMMLLVSFILYGGLIYFIIIAMKRDPIRMLPEPLRGFLSVPTNRYGTVMVIILILLVPVLSSEGVTEDEGPYDGPSSDEMLTITYTEGEYLEEGESVSFIFDTGGYVIKAEFNITWTDEDADIGMENEGDTFRWEFIEPDSETSEDEFTNTPGSDGRMGHGRGMGSDIGGPWNVTVIMVDAGDQKDILTGGLIRTEEDRGNDFELTAWFKYSR